MNRNVSLDMDTLHKGALGLTRAMYEYYKQGYNVSLPVIDAQDYDLVIEKNGLLQSVQCKYTNFKNESGNYSTGLRSVRTNTKITRTKPRGKYDFLFVLCGNDSCYSIPVEMLPKTEITLHGKYMQYKIGKIEGED